MAWSGYYIAATRQCFVMAPRENQTPYMAAWTTMRGLGFSLAPMAVGLALNALEQGRFLRVRPGEWHLNRYTSCFLLVSAGFAAVVFIFRRLKTPGEMATRHLATRIMGRLASWR
jgi:hypothetical protein